MARRNPLLDQARSDAHVRYAAPLADLLSARRTAHHQYQRDVQTAEDSAAAIKQAAAQSVKALLQIYNEADKTRQIAGDQIGSASGPGNALATALSAEHGAATERFAGDRAAAQTEAVSRGADATAGLVFQKQNALQGYRASRADLMGQTRDLHREIGAFTDSRAGELADAQAQAQFDQSKFDETKRHNKATERISAGRDPATGKAVAKPLTAAQRHQRQADTADARDAISAARTWIQRLSKGNKVEKAVGILKTGGSLPVPTGQTDSRGQAKVHYVDVPKVSSDFIRAAVELEGRGYLSQTSIHNLRVRNVHVPDSWLPPKFKLPNNFRPEVSVR